VILDKKDDHKGCFNYKRLNHFIANYPKLQKDKSKKKAVRKKVSRVSSRKILLATWNELDKKSESDKDKKLIWL